MKVGRNEPCPCNSGKKYKKCCMNKDNLLTRYNPVQLKAEPRIFKTINVYIEIVSFFDCSKCGKCCSNAPDLLYSDEYINFDDALLYWEDDLPGFKNPCEFFVDNKCKLHGTNKKPRACRFAPFQVGECDDPITLSHCELGNKIFEKYSDFIEETGIGEYDDVFNMMYPFNDIKRAKAFLEWLKEGN